MLAQQRESQDSDTTHASDSRNFSWRVDVGSDPNLNKKKDSGMRKSTLLRRLWGNNKPLSERSSRLSGAYYDWQYSFGKLSSGKSTHSLGSTHSSPEHKSMSRRSLNEEFKTSPKHYSKFSPKHQLEVNKNYIQTTGSMPSPKKKLNGNLPIESNFNNVSSLISIVSDQRISSTTSKTTETEFENYSTRSTGSTSTTSRTMYSDNSDSAYTFTHSNYTQSSNSNSNTTQSSQPQTEKLDNKLSTDQNSNRKKKSDPENYVKYSAVSESTQTSDSTNLNVISNVKLSQSTLNLIFNQVLQDVQNKSPDSININTFSAVVSEPSNKLAPDPKVIKVQEMPSFYLKRKDEITITPEHNRIIKYMISNVGTGSPYSKPAEVPQIVVPRFSALPRTSSMEVNTSSGDSTDKESDTMSLVDSLEDPSSPRIDINLNRHDNRPVRGEISPLLPDNSKKIKSPKNATFFIPIETDAETEVKPVAEHLPAKVKEKLSKRQIKREQKMAKTKLISPRSDSNYISASENGNPIQFIVHNSPDYNLNSAPALFPDINFNKPKRKSKAVLPSIDPIRKFKSDYETGKNLEDKIKEKLNKSVKRKSVFKAQDASDPFRGKIKTTHWSTKGLQKPEKLTPIYTTRSEYVYDTAPRRIYHKTETNDKRIEILEIMECVDGTGQNQMTRNKSKIPVLVHQKLPKIQQFRRGFEKPAFLDFEQNQISDPKIDQLIANILIDSLNIAEVESAFIESKEPRVITKGNINERRPSAPQPSQIKLSGQRYQQKFEVIPEELSMQSSFEEAKNNSAEDESNLKQNEKVVEKASEILAKLEISEENENKLEDAEEEVSKMSKGKEAVTIVKDESLSTIPKGWITFYMLRKSQGSPDSTSDEGINISKKYQNL